MLKVYVIKTSTSEAPLAEIATDGHIIDWRVDNTKGTLPKSVGKDFAKLSAMCAGSSHLTMEEPKEATAQLLTYILTNGDTVEITTDGKTAILNGKLLAEEEKNSLFAAIKTGQIKISQKADLANPVPVLPSMHIDPELKPESVKSVDQEVLAGIQKLNKEKKMKHDLSDSDYDYSIEEADYRGNEDPEWTKALMYRLKHGDKNGR